MLLPLPARGTVDSALSQGRAWLIAQQNADGSFGPGAELLPRDSAAAVLALTGGPADPAIGRGADYLTALAESAAYYRALRVQALARAGSSFTPLIDTLGEFRNGEGIGAFGTYYSNLFDTTQAIEAYAEDEQARQLDIVPLLDYLRTSQGADGGWGYLPGNPSQVYYTGEALWAVTRLHTLAVTPQVTANARTFLLSKLQTNGSFGSVLETAVAYRALIGSGYQFTAAQPDVLAALLAAQRSDGSWEGDAYTTAEVVRALASYRPNLVIAALSAPGTASAGTAVQVSVTVQNVGPQAAAASRLVLRAGSATGTDVRAEAAVPALAAGATFAATLPVATAGDTGELVLYAVADADGAVAEQSELDNARSVRIALTGLPDLAVFTANLSLSLPRPQPLQAFAIRATIQNLGEQPVTSFGYRLSRVVAGVPVTPPLSTGTRGPLAAGASLLLDVTGVSLPEGEHTVRLELDQAGAITEASEEDNVAEYTFFVVDDTLADLSLADADFSTLPADAVPGQPVNVTLIVRNKGNQSGNAVVDFFDGESTTGTPVLTKSANVNAGSSATLTGSFTPQASSVVLTAVVDRAGTVPESDENNNRARRYLRALPDLAVGYDGVSLLPERPLAGDTTTVRITVRNAGSQASTSAPVALYAGLPEAGGVEVGRSTVGAIPAAGNATVEVPWTAAGGVTNPTVVVDPDGAILERSESNNRTVRRVTVQRASGPNLVVSAVDMAQATHSALDLKLTGSIGLTVANQGTAPTGGAYLVRLFEDRDGDRRFAAPDRELGSTVLDQPLAVGATTPVTFAVDTTLAFARSLVLAEADAVDTIAETREDDNQRALFGDCEETTPTASYVPVEKWWLPDVDVQSTPAVVQLSDDNGDGAIDSRDNPDVVVHATDAQGRVVLAVSGLDGSRLWTFRSTAANPLQSDKANVSAADLDGDGVAEVLAVQTDNKLLALDHRGLVHWTSEPIESTGGDWRGGSAVGDLTGDGVPEIVVGRAVLSNTGKRIAVGTANAARNHNYYGPFGTAYLYDQQHAIIADVDLDGRNEIVAGDTVYRLVDGVLTVVWDWVEHDNMLKDGFAAVGNLDTDAFPEIVYVSAGFVKVIQHDGAAQRGSYARIVPIQPPIGPDSMITYWGGPPTIADLTGDGVPEILVAGDTYLTAFKAGLGVLWRKPTFDFAAMTSATAFDLDGDGQREVIYNDESFLYILDGLTGTVLHQRPNTSLTGTELPVVADLDNDGVADILVGSNRHRSGDGSTRGLHALGHAGWRGTRAIWNQPSYHVTNVQLDGTVPAHEVPSWQLTNTFRANLELPRPQQRKLPNVTIGLPRLGSAGPQGIPVTLRIGNGGAAPAGAGIEVTLAAQSGGPVVGSAHTLTALAPGEWEDVTVYWQAALTEPVAAVAVVDPTARVDECDRTDNSLGFTVEERLLPDLAIPAGGVTATGTTTAGQLIDLAVLVKNNGPAASPATVVRVSDGTVTLGEAPVAALTPGSTATVTVHVDTLLLAAGLHSFHAAVDPDELVLEVDEDNNGGLVQLTLAAASKPDLAATTLTVEPATVAAGASSTLRVEVLNRGTALAGGFQLSFRVNGVEVSRPTYPGQLDNAGRATLSYALSTLGRQGTLQITAVADPANLVSEVNETNNTATASLAVSPSPVSLAVSSDKPRYKPTETAQVTVAATNAGTQPAAGSLRVVLQDALGAEVGTIGERPVTLPTGGSVQAFSWPAANALPGPYFAVATFYANGVAVAVGQTSFSVIADIALQAQIATNQATYRPSSTVFMTGGVRNVATSTLVAGAVADLSILNPGGQSVFHQTSALGQVLPGAFLPVAGTWPVGTAAPGLYRVELRVLGSTNELLALGTSGFRVESTGDTGAGVRGSLTVTPTMQGVGGSLAVEYSLENRGNAAAPGLVAHLEMLALATGEPVRTLDVPTPLLAGASAAGRWRIQTTDVLPSQYLVSLAAVVDGAMSPLGSELVTLLPGLLVDDLSLREGDSGTHAAQVTVRLQPANDAPVTVQLATADGSAIGGEDYDAASGTLTFAPGETSKTFAIDVHGDTTEELHETLLVNLSDANGAWIADGQAVVTIEDEEGCASTDLLENGGGEEVAVDGIFAGWTGTGWEGGYAAPQPFAGDSYFLARAGSALELTQDVSLLPFASRIDAGGQAFVFEGFVAAASPAARVVVDYRDALGQVLDSFDSGLLG
ncbi:MAG TPA: CARDB domain-containing protein, partial [Thermoanaerobaculia bacterium]|nr:CARDB domain-containing protein [Thermoanaerobaculia bacterium]